MIQLSRNRIIQFLLIITLSGNSFAQDRIAPTVTLLQKPDVISDTNIIQFFWIGNDDVSSESGLTYQYKLEGYDADFSAWSSSKSASYDLVNGPYNMVINCKDLAGNYSRVPLEYSFIVNANPKIISNTKFDKGIWATRIFVDKFSENIDENILVLHKEHSLTELDDIIPVRLFSGNDFSLIGGNLLIADNLSCDTVFTASGTNFILDIPDEIQSSGINEFIIEWGILNRFGWQENQLIPDGFPNLTDIPPFERFSIRDELLDSEGNLWRAAKIERENATDDSPVSDVWIYIDKCNADSIILPEKEIGYFASSWQAGVNYKDIRNPSIRLTEIDNKIFVCSTVDLDEEDYQTGSRVDYDYEKYIINILESDGTVTKTIEGAWKKDYQYYLPRLTNDRLWFSSKQYTDTEAILRFTIIDSQGNVVLEDQEYYRINLNTRDGVSPEGVYPIGDNNCLLMFEHDWQTANSDDRQKICYQIRDNNGTLVKGTTILNPALLADNVELDDEYFIRDVINDNLGRVWISYEHDQQSTDDTYFCVVIDGTGSIVHGPVQYPDDLDLNFCDRDNYMWTDESQKTHLIDQDYNESVFSLHGFIHPNHVYNNKPAYVFHTYYKLFDRWEPKSIDINLNDTVRVDEIELFNQPINSDVSVESLELKLNDVSVYSGDATTPDKISFEFPNDSISGNNTITIDESSLLGGNLILTIPVAFNLKPKLIKAYSDLSFKEDFNDTLITQSLSESFSDDQSLNFDLEYDQDILTAFIANDTIFLSPVSNQFGVSQFIISATDAEYKISDTLTISIESVNDRPEIADQVFSIEENQANGAFIGKIIADDVDEEDKLIYSIIDGNLGSTFKLVDTTGNLYVNDSTRLDYESNTSMEFTVMVSDNGQGHLDAEAKITVIIQDIAEQTGINSTYYKNRDYIIFPNPVTDFLEIRILQEELNHCNFTLLDLTGKAMLYRGPATNTETLDMRHLPLGVYFLKIQNKERIEVFKILKN